MPIYGTTELLDASKAVLKMTQIKISPTSSVQGSDLLDCDGRNTEGKYDRIRMQDVACREK